MVSNLQTILSLNYVDATKTITNDLWEIYSCLGIKATSAILLSELYTCLTFDGMYIDSRHVHSLVAAMTRSGSISAVTRHAMQSLGAGVLHKASYEETHDVLTKASFIGETDNLGGSSERVMTGLRPLVGSGIVRVVTPVIECIQIQTVEPLEVTLSSFSQKGSSEQIPSSTAITVSSSSSVSNYKSACVRESNRTIQNV